MLNCKGLDLFLLISHWLKFISWSFFLSVTYSGDYVRKNKRNLLAYIKRNEDGPVLIDVVELTRNGHSFRLNGDLWKRNFALFLGDLCTHQNGENMLALCDDPISLAYLWKILRDLPFDLKVITMQVKFRTILIF